MPDLKTHQAIIELVLAWTLTAVFVFTAIFTCIGLAVRLRNAKYFAALFSALILELIALCLGFFKGFLTFETRPLTRQVEASESGNKDIKAEFEALQKKLLDCAPRNEPITLIGLGTTVTNDVFVPPSPHRRTVKIAAKAECLAGVGGEMHITVSGATAPCESGIVYRNPGAPELLAAEVTCPDEIPAGEGRTYRATAPNHLASGRLVRLEVTATEAPP